MVLKGRFPSLRMLCLPVLVLIAGLLLPASWSGTGSTPPATSAQASTLGATDSSCSTAYYLPGDIGDIGDFGADPPDQEDLDIYSWQLFLALNAPAVGQSVSSTGDNSTLWGGSVAAPITATSPGWSSTDDLLEQATLTSTPGYGVHYYPKECQAISNYSSYRVVDELDKVDDGFFEATVKGLSGSPAVAANGTFLRYEILISPVTFNTIVTNQWYLSSVLAKATTGLNFPCGVYSAGGSSASPADAGIGPITVKNAWMDASGVNAATFHTENLLVFTSGSENSTGKNTCELKTMALVGMHIAHKTTQQSAWTWSTFEHNANAPDCTTTPAPPPGAPPDQNTSCPAVSTRSYNLFPSSAATASKFQTCNATPAQNNPSGKTCDEGFCADLAPNSTAGYSQLCRQVPLSKNYPTAYAQSQACNQATGSASAWSNYALISTQWFTAFGANPTCQNAATTVTPNQATIRAEYAPQVTMSDGKTTFPYLANTSMESYERSVCMGCHQQATAGGSGVSTDLMYFLQLEVPAAPVNQPPSFRTKQGSTGG